MGLHPEYVTRLEEALADVEAGLRKLKSVLRDGTQDTATLERCPKCGEKGVVETVVGSSTTGQFYTSQPCDCPKGLPFRQAAHAQRIKNGRDAAAGRD